MALGQAWDFLKLSGARKECESCRTVYGNLPEGEAKCRRPGCGGNLRDTQ